MSLRAVLEQALLRRDPRHRRLRRDRHRSKRELRLPVEDVLGTSIVMRDDRSVCVHAGFCGNRVTNVWKLVSGSATDDSIVRAQVMAMIERCPSGALTYRIETDGEDIEPELADEIGVIDDGPLWVTGRVVVSGPDGEEIEWRNRMTLCRCGQSKNKPLCDGSHVEAGFVDH
ncbi:MAG: CDGSH iron-sulfur domain-containing protein [Acidimicrobiales bacterium]